MSAVTAAEPRRWVAPPRRAVHRGAPRAQDRDRRRKHSIPALDGIRAIAVTLVLLDHGGIPGLPGGFLGVDVFFVLSGFLITSLLLDELGRTGRVGLTEFWIRRARRLLPALVVLVLAVVFLRDLFPSDALTGLREQAVAAFFWMANWSMIAQDTGYFTQGGAPSPLQHLWSLGVEEQYYLIWPVLLIGLVGVLLLFTRRRNTQPTIGAIRLAVFIVATVGAAASATAAILLVSEDTVDRVYFGTDTRVQALLVGAAAAALLVRDWSALTTGWSVIRSRWGRLVARGLPFLGLAGLIVAAHYVTGAADEFRHGALIGVALAAIALIAPVALYQDGVVARALAWRPLVALGAISYGVYLWHWPIFLVINGERTGLTGTSLFVVRCIVTVGVAAASWWVIEQPIRRWRPVRVPMLRLATATVATAAVLTLQTVPVGLQPDSPGEASLPPGVSTAALERPVSPIEVRSPIDYVQRGATNAHTVSVFGDSIAWTLMRYLPKTPGVAFMNHTVIGCGVVRGGPYRYFGETLDQKPECDTWPQRWSNRVENDKPDVVLLMVGRWEIMDRMFRGRWTHIGDPEFDAYLTHELTRAVDILGSTGAHLVVANEPYNRRGERPDGGLYPEDQPERVDRWNALLRRVVGDRPNVTILDLNEKLAPDGSYTADVDGIRVRSDGVHLTPEGVEWLTPWITEAVTRVGQ